MVTVEFFWHTFSTTKMTPHIHCVNHFPMCQPNECLREHTHTHALWKHYQQSYKAPLQLGQEGGLFYTVQNAVVSRYDTQLLHRQQSFLNLALSRSRNTCEQISFPLISLGALFGEWGGRGKRLVTKNSQFSNVSLQRKKRIPLFPVS